MATYIAYIRQYKEYKMEVEVEDNDDPGFHIITREVNDIVNDIGCESLDEAGLELMDEGFELIDYEILED